VEKVKIAPSILSADWGKLRKEVKAIEAAGADWIHVDVMDGQFVPPITLGSGVVKVLNKAVDIPLDVHLMVNTPEKQIKAFAEAGADIITVHYEACPDLRKVIEEIHSFNVKAGVAINPVTPVDMVDDIISEIDLFLVMSVNPGWGGQKFIPYVEGKLKEASKLIKRFDKRVLLEVDGGINSKIAPMAKEAGAEVLVSGSFIFSSEDYREAINKLRKE